MTTTATPTVTAIARRPQVRNLTGYSDTTLDERIKRGLLTPGVPLGARAVGWPLHEIDAINRARIAGKTEEEIRELVRRLIAARTEAAAA